MYQRYPFLDKQVVQEYLWLTAAAKNAYYKAPLRQLFEAVRYPFTEKQVGLDGDFEIKVGSESLRFQQGNLEVFKKQNDPAALSAQLDVREVNLREAELEVAAAQRALQLRSEELAAEAGGEMRGDLGWASAFGPFFGGNLK
ncbi:unnamed protein product [Effrenium voratum]|nr:unnamed protein product [Effrenium voratum]